MIVFFLSRFDFCTSDSQSPVENLGQILLGDRIRPSPYEVFNLRTKGRTVQSLYRITRSSKKHSLSKTH